METKSCVATDLLKDQDILRVLHRIERVELFGAGLVNFNINISEKVRYLDQTLHLNFENSRLAISVKNARKVFDFDDVIFLILPNGGEIKIWLKVL